MFSSLLGPLPSWVLPQALSSLSLPKQTGCNGDLTIIPTALGCWCWPQSGCDFPVEGQQRGVMGISEGVSAELTGPIGTSSPLAAHAWLL